MSLSERLTVLGWSEENAVDRFQESLGLQGSSSLFTQLKNCGTLVDNSENPVLISTSLAIIDKFALSLQPPVQETHEAVADGATRTIDVITSTECIEKLQKYITSQISILQDLTVTR